MLNKIAFLLLLAAAPATTIADTMPKAGSFGFNWLDPGSQCQQLDAKALKAVKHCEISDNAFGLELKSHTCSVSAKVELVIYDTAAQCQQALETMQANGD